MNTEAYGVTMFCDDIRREMNGKLTLVGCYASELNFDSPPPGNLPRFAALINLRIPSSINFKKISIKVVQTDGEDERLLIDANIDMDLEEITKLDAPALDEAGRVVLMAFPCQWTNIKFTSPGMIKVRAYIDDETEVRLGALKINFSKEKTGQGTGGSQ
ncbi:DUF6941 family protein [Pseudooceanicola nanhaiensis]|uniref:DUF6941 family protein n=1 Tax=Pseudooceanicola nanhaiensis TaxID=375761 RepID=UPI003518C6FB